MLRLSRSIVGNDEAAAVARVLLEDGYLGMGSEVQALERELAEYLGVQPEHVTCVNSGTAAVHLALASILEPGDEVLVQSLTFVATFQAITAAGGVPVPCEVVPETVTIDLDDARRRLTSKTRAIVPVHYASSPGDLRAIYAFASEHGLRVVEDAAHAFGSFYEDKKVGSFGDIACFSFDGIKNITTGEGGAIVTADAEVGQNVRDARLLGVEKDTEMRYRSERSWEFDVSRQGWRYHMSNLFAALGRVQLRRLELEFAPKRIALSQHYRRQLKDVPGLRFVEAGSGRIVPHIQPIRILNGRRDALFDALKADGIQCGIHYKPNHLLKLYGGGALKLPTTEQLYRELISVPLHPGLEIADVERVCSAIRSFLEEKSA